MLTDARVQSPVGFAIIAYPLSTAYRASLEKMLKGPIHYVSLPQLRQIKSWELFRTLREIKTECLYLPLEDDSVQALLPILQMLASITRARTIEVLYPNLRREVFKRWRVALLCVSFIKASIAGARDLRRCRRDATALLSSPRVEVRRVQNDRVLYLKTNLMLGVKAGGSVGHVAGVVNELSRRDCEVYIASAEMPVGLDSKVKWISIPLMPYLSAPFESNYYRYNLVVIKHLGQWMEPPPLFIYQRMSTGNFAGVALSRQAKIPLVLEYNNSEPWAARNWGGVLKYNELALLTENACIRHAHLIITVSNVLKEELQSRGVSPERIIVYPNCIDPEMFNPERYTCDDIQELRKRYHIPLDAVVVTFLGTFGPWHGAEVLARAIRELVDTESEWLRAKKVHFLMIGDGIRVPDVKCILGEGLCMPYVTLTGLVNQSEAPVYLAASDILVSPHVPNADGSRFFGSPTKLFEYMAMGKAIIASDLEQIGEILKNSLRSDELPRGEPNEQEATLSVLCRPGDVSSLLNAIKFLTQESAWRAKLGRNARDRVLTDYTWEHHTQAIMTRLNDILDARTVGVP